MESLSTVNNVVKVLPESKKQSETSNKLTTNWQQTSNKGATKLATKGQQTSNKIKAGTLTSAQSGNKLDSQLATEVATKGQQTNNKVATILGFCELTGLQKTLTEIIFTYCKENASELTPPISISHLAQTAGSPVRSVKVTIQRLAKKGILSKDKFKNGRGGWTQYRIEKGIYSELLRIESGNKLTTKWQQTSNKLDSQLATQLATSIPSSSSSINTNTNTTKDDDFVEWDLIQTPESLKELGFGKSHIDQIKNKFQFTAEEVSKFLESFAYDLQSGERERLKKRGINPLGYFFGAMKQGGYNSVSEGFKTSEELGEEEQLKKLEQRKTEKEKRRKKIYDLEFENWIEESSREELEALEKPIGEYLGPVHVGTLKEYFKKEVFSGRY